MKLYRIQRKRTKGWHMPENTVYVGRPSQWGNPYPADKPEDRKLAAARFALHLEIAVDAVKMGKKTTADKYFMHIAENLHELRGKNLACWCAPDQPCHADILLKLANQEAA